MNAYLKYFLSHLGAIVLIALASMVYFSPAAFQGKVLTQSDVIQAQGMQAELRKYTEQEEREILWTNSMFGGMPAFQIWGATGNNFNVLATATSSVFKLFGVLVNNPHGLLFGLGLGMYLLLWSFNLDWRFALAGSLLFAFSTVHIHLIEAGHLNKVYTMAYLPATLAGILLTFRGKYLLGGGITALFTCMQMASNHPQITYYFFILMGILGIIKLIDAVQQKTVPSFVKAAGTLVLAGVIGVMPYITKLWTTYEYSKETIRGKSELTTTANGTKPRDGLTKEYAFSWSLGVTESFSLVIPNYMGATSGEFFAMDRDSESFKALQAMNSPRANELAQLTSHYWGEQPFTSGSPYLGMIPVLLFCISMFVIKGPLKNWGIAAVITILFIGWGRHFALLNYALFDYFPLFNKFRAVTMVLGLLPWVLLLFGMLGLKELFNPKHSAEIRQKAVLYGGAVASGILILGLVIGFGLDYMGPRDSSLGPFPQVLDALRADRAGIMRTDVMRSLLFCGAGIGLLWAMLKYGLNKYAVLIGLSLIGLVDLIGVNKRYLHNDEFQEARASQQIAEPREVDNVILRDQNLTYRVFDLSRQTNPFSDARPSYFHRSIGGYHAAKLMIFNELIEKYLTRPSQYPHLLNMLHTVYVINDKGGRPDISLNKETLGAAWFVDEFQVVPNADAELEAVGNFNPAVTAIVQQKYADKLAGLQINTAGQRNVKITKYIPDHLTYEYSADSEQLMVFSEVYYPEDKGWHVYIDGQRQEGLIKANYVLRAIRVPAGTHKLEMIFEPDSYYTGRTISRVGTLLMSLLFLGGIITPFIRNRKDLEQLVESEGDANLFVAEAKPKAEAKKVSKTVSKRSTGKKKKK